MLFFMTASNVKVLGNIFSGFTGYSIYVGDSGVVDNFEVAKNTFDASLSKHGSSAVDDATCTILDNIYLSGAVNGIYVTPLTMGGLLPLADNTYYVGKNDDDAPLAIKGVIFKDTTNGKYYRLEITNGAAVITDLTD